MKDLLSYIKNDRGKKIGLAVFLAGLSALFTFAGYEMIRSPSESIFLSYFNAEEKPYALSLVPLVMAFFIYLYGYILSKLGSMKAMILSMLFSFFSFVFLYFLLKFFPSKPLAFFIFIFKESYIVIIAEEYWSYIDSILKDEEGKIFNGPIAGLGALGSLMGGWFVSSYVGYFKTDLYIIFSAICLLPAVLIFYLAYKDTGEPLPSSDEKNGKKGHLHLSILLENKTILFIAFMIFSVQVIATLFDINFSHYVKEVFTNKDLRTAFLGSFWMKVNIVSFSMQFFFTPILLKRLSIKFILISIPFIHILNSVFSLLFPGILTASIAFLVFKSLDYSIFRAAKETLYIPFSYDTRYRAKQVADAFTYRFSKGFTSLTLSLTDIIGKISVGIFPYFTIFFSSLWVLIAGNIKTNKNQ